MQFVSFFLLVALLIAISLTNLKAAPSVNLDEIESTSEYYIKREIVFIYKKYKLFIQKDLQQPSSRVVCSGQGIVVVSQLGQIACAEYCKILGANGGVCNSGTCMCKW